ncbi:MAG: glycosyltransferase family 2 protein, partial [Bacteroidetes bacterium]|nr:glycosyltransferase family 2 protein [Bacteroidota bacterium]
LICTYNGEKNLPATLDHLKRLNTDHNRLLYEIVIVDNASTDGTYSLACKYAADYSNSVSITVLQEPKQGKVYAMQKALPLLKYDYVVICDDDNWLQEDYLMIADEVFETYPKVGVLGGMSKLAVEEGFETPDWFWKVAPAYAVGRQVEKPGFVDYKQNLWGAGCIIKKEPFSFCINQVEMLLANDRGEDTEICYRMLMLGYELYYEDRLVLQHFMPPNRLRWDAVTLFLQINKESYRQEVLPKYHLFFKYYIYKRFRWLSKMKWSVIYMCNRLGFVDSRSDKNYRNGVEIFTDFGVSNEFKRINTFYKLSKTRIN